MSSDQPTSDAIEIRLTPTQKERYFRQTGMIMHSISLYPAQLKRLSAVAVKAGSESLPVSRSAVRQLLEPRPPGERGGGPFAVEVALTPGQKEQIEGATGKLFASLRIVPDDVTVTYRETWYDAAPMRVGRTVVIKPAGQAYETSDADRVVELPAGDGSEQGVFGTGRHPLGGGARRGGRRRRLRGWLRLGRAALAGRLGRDGVQETVVTRRSMQRSVELDNTRLVFHAGL